jgi:predicted PurR-regulated permease PerM
LTYTIRDISSASYDDPLMPDRNPFVYTSGEIENNWTAGRPVEPSPDIFIPHQHNIYTSMARFTGDMYPFLLIVIISLAALIAFWSIMDMVLLGASLAVVLIPVHHILSKKTNQVMSASLVTVGVFLVFAGFAFATISILQANTGTLASVFTAIGAWLGNPASNPTLFGLPLNKSHFAFLFSEGDALFLNYWTTILGNIPTIAFKMFIFLFSFFILLLHGEELNERIMVRLPKSIKGYAEQLAPVTVDVLYAIYVVQIAIAVLTFFISLPVFYLLGYGNILFYSFLAAFCELVPVLGSSVAFILIGAYSFSINDMSGVIILFVLGYLVVSCLPEIFIRPELVGRRAKIHPVIMFIGIIGGLLTMGLAGFVLGPLIIVILMTSYRIWVNERKMPVNLDGNKADRCP